MNSHLLKDPFASRVSILPAINFCCCCCVQSFFLSLCSYPSLLFIFVIKTYKVSSCVSLAPAI